LVYNLVLGAKNAFCAETGGGKVVYIGGHTPVKIFFRLRLQNLFPSVYPPIVADGEWLAVVFWCACLRVEAMVSMSARCCEGSFKKSKVLLKF
jgi:hypothetical protein